MGEKYITIAEITVPQKELSVSFYLLRKIGTPLGTIPSQTKYKSNSQKTHLTATEVN